MLHRSSLLNLINKMNKIKQRQLAHNKKKTQEQTRKPFYENLTTGEIVFYYCFGSCTIIHCICIENDEKSKWWEYIIY